MSEFSRYQGNDPVINEVSALDTQDPDTVSNVFVLLKKEAQDGWGIRENDIKKNNWDIPAKLLIARGLAHWEGRENPNNGEQFKILVLTEN